MFCVNTAAQGTAWPSSVAPFRAHLVGLGDNEDRTVAAQTEKIYDLLVKAGVEVLWDDRPVAPGIKLADADLLGLPFRLVASHHTTDKNLVEVKSRTNDEVKLVAPQNLCVSLG